MSDPVKNVDIEDVLSSVKRLVSAGSRPVDAYMPEKQDSVPQPDRFVLTPALRVDDPDDVAESNGNESDDIWATEVLFDAEEDTTLVLELPDAPEMIAAARPNRESLEATIAELEAAVTAQPDEWEPDGSEVHTVPTWDTVTYPTLDEIEDAIPVEDDEDRFADDIDDHRDPVDELARIGLTFATPHLHAVETAPEEDDLADFGDELATDVAELPADENLEAYLEGEPAVIDEDMLRDMVMQIVREELQGKMGERITRNVRKMVRREIHRVVSSQEFD